MADIYAHPRYVRSRSDQQLRNSRDADDTSACKPEDTAHGMPIVPCGLIAWSLFNDTYDFTRNNQPMTINKREISWKSDRDHKFGKNVYPRNFQNNTLVGGKTLDANKSVSVQSYLIIYNKSPLSCMIFTLGHDLLKWVYRLRIMVYLFIYLTFNNVIHNMKMICNYVTVKICK